MHLGDSPSDIVDVLGTPTHWEGGPELSAEESDIWLYGPLQVNFDAQLLAQTIRFHFRHHIANQTAILQTNFSPFEIAERLPEDCGELTGFEQFLASNGVSFSRSKNEIGQSTVLCGTSTVTKFSQLSDYDASMAAGKPILVPGELIVSSSVSKVR